MTAKHTAQTPQNKTIFSRRIVMLTLGFLFAANAVCLDGTVVAIPNISSQFGVSAGQAQLVTVLFLLGYALGHIPVGLLGDRYGRRPVILIGLTMASIMSIIAVFAPSFEILIASRFFQGVATCAAGLLARAMVRDVAKGHQASRLNSIALCYLAGLIFIAPILSGFLLQIWSWRLVLAAVSSYLLVTLVLTIIFIPETMHTEKHTNSAWNQFVGSLKGFIRSRQSLLASLLGAIAFSTYFIYANIGSSMIVDVYGLPASRFGLIFAMTAAVQFVASMANSRLVESKGSDFVLRFAGAVCAAGVALAIYWLWAGHPPLSAMIAIAVCFTITHGLVLPNSIALALDPLPKTAGFAAAINGMTQTFIAAIVGFIVSGLYDGSIETILTLFASFGGITLVIFFASREMLTKKL